MTETADLPQGDVGLLNDPIATALLGSRELARLAYTASDGTPRVIPIGWLCRDGVFVFGTVARSPKVAALRRRAAVALTIDRLGPPPEQLLVRGQATVEEVDGVPADYLDVQTRFYGADQANAARAELERAGVRMALITVRPTWVGVFDFQTRVPAALTGAGE